MADIDYERAKLLMEFIVEAEKHGPAFYTLAKGAREELKEMVDDVNEQEAKKPQARTVPGQPVDPTTIDRRI